MKQILLTSVSIHYTDATPAHSPLSAYYRIRVDIIDTSGKLTLRHAGVLRHLGVGPSHAKRSVLTLTDKAHATVTDRTTGEILGTYLIDSSRNYWPKQKEEPDHRPDSS